MKPKNNAMPVFLSCLVMLSALLLAASSGAALAQDLFCDDLPYVENVYLTTSYGAAPADVDLNKVNFLECTKGKYALCYYSGPEPMPCTLGEDGVAECTCQVFEATPERPMYVLINAILNTCVYIETITQCGKYGEGLPGAYCPNMGEPYDQAIAILVPNLCEYIAKRTFDTQADYISAFSTEIVTAPNGEKMGPLDCTECSGTNAGTYAGCMTASCTGLTPGPSGEPQYTQCTCPTFDGPYQHGSGDKSCDLGSENVWSAAYNPAGCPDPIQSEK